MSEGVPLEPYALDPEGAGVAVHEDLEVHVMGALPGERVTATLEHVSPHRRADGRRDAWASLVAVERAAPTRVTPACPAYGACGGCVLQHLAETEQLAWKRELVVRAFASWPKGAPPLPEIEACERSPRSLGYRNQAKYVVGPSSDGGALVFGAYAPRTHQIVDLAGCRLGEPALEPVATTLRALCARFAVPAYDERTQTGWLRHVVLRGSGNGEVLVALVAAHDRFTEAAALADELRAARPEVVGVLLNLNAAAGNVIFGREASDRVLSGAATLEETIAGVPIPISAAAFLQLNRSVAAAAYATIRSALAGQLAAPAPRLIDVFAGVGAIAFSLADLASEVIAIEGNANATQAGSAAAKRAGLAHVRFVTADAAAGLSGLPRAAGDVVVLNPPRAGAGPAVIAEIVRLAPRVLLYLSCNPVTLARDLAALIGASAGFEVIELRPFDMLPHTAHVETFALVVRV